MGRTNAQRAPGLRTALILAVVLALAVPGMRGDQEPPSGVLLVTALAGTSLPCGCSTSHRGDLAQLAAAAKRHRAGTQGAVLVDAGHVPRGSGEAALFLRILQAMQYDAVALAPAEWPAARAILGGNLKLPRAAHPGLRPLLCFARGVRGYPSPVVAHSESMRAAVIALASPDGNPDVPAGLGKSITGLCAPDVGAWDVVVAMAKGPRSYAAAIARILASGSVPAVVVDSSNAGAMPGKESGVPIVGVPPLGRLLRVTLERTGPSQLAVTRAELVASAGGPRDPRVASLLEDHYRRRTKATVEQSRRRDAAGRPWYASARACGTCHPAQASHWSRTAHARAEQRLHRPQRLVSECLGCHSERYRRTSRVPASDEQAGIECGACHGDGVYHTANKDARFVVRKPPERACTQCHTPESSPSFDYASYLARVAH